MGEKLRALSVNIKLGIAYGNKTPEHEAVEVTVTGCYGVIYKGK